MAYLQSFDEIRDRPLTDKCIVLDLDHTLLNTFNSSDLIDDLEIYTNPKHLETKRQFYHFILDDVYTHRGDGEQTEICGIRRPHLSEFLDFCFGYFKIVAVWSAGQAKYVKRICHDLFRDFRDPHCVYTRNHCVPIWNEEREEILEKPLIKMMEVIPGMSLDNTFVIDDNLTTFERVNFENGILIPPYKPAETLEDLRKDDLRLLQLRDWFLRPEVLLSEDIRDLDKSQIFL